VVVPKKIKGEHWVQGGLKNRHHEVKGGLKKSAGTPVFKNKTRNFCYGKNWDIYNQFNSGRGSVRSDQLYSLET
jgi:hypothetical protein